MPQTCIVNTLDVTGDALHDCITEYRLTLAERAGEVSIYWNADKTVKMVTQGRWHYGEMAHEIMVYRVTP